MRIQGWESKLNEYLEAMIKKPFSWGECDCLLFVSDWCLIASGCDPMSQKIKGDPDTIRGAYSDEESAMALIAQYRKSLSHIMDVHFERQSVFKAKRGDIVMAKLDNGNTFGICIGRGNAFFKTDDGMTPLKIDKCKIAWSVE